MKLSTKAYIVVALVVAIVLAPIAIYSLQTPTSETFGSSITKTHNVGPHERISITDASDFTTPGTGSGCECVTAGSGSSSDPFVISDWKLSASEGNGISIASTSVYFIIRNIMVNATEMHDSVVLRNVANGTIQESYISGGGISLYNSNEISIINNTITGSRFGVLLEGSNNNTISGNRLDHIQQVGIFVRASNNLIAGNHLTSGYFGGINIDGLTGSGSGNRVENNVVEGNAQYGIGLWQARNNLVRANVVSMNGGAGIMLAASCSNNQVEQNSVVKNNADGILVDEQSAENKISGNTATGNGDGANSFDLHDEGSDNVWLSNTFNTKKPDAIR